jgi:hypothetical protein
MTSYAQRIIEAGARAMFDGETRAMDGWTWERECENELLRLYWLNQSRACLAAVIAALMEPPDSMADKGESSLICGPDPGDLETSPSPTWAHAKSCFRAMLSQLQREISAPEGGR